MAQTPLTQFKYSDVVAGPQTADYKTFFQNVQGLPEWMQQRAFESQYGGKNETQQLIEGFGQLQKAANDPETRKAILQDQLAFQKEQMRQAAPYKLLFELPNQITRAFAAPGEIRLAGALAANQLVAEGIRGVAAADIPPLNYQRPNIQYF